MFWLQASMQHTYEKGKRVFTPDNQIKFEIDNYSFPYNENSQIFDVVSTQNGYDLISSDDNSNPPISPLVNKTSEPVILPSFLKIKLLFEDDIVVALIPKPPT